MINNFLQNIAQQIKIYIAQPKAYYLSLVGAKRSDYAVQIIQSCFHHFPSSFGVKTMKNNNTES